MENKKIQSMPDPFQEALSIHNTQLTSLAEISGLGQLFSNVCEHLENVLLSKWLGKEHKQKHISRDRNKVL